VSGMRLDIDGTREVLADAWERWGHRCAELTRQQWATPTRCRPWDVRALVAHLCPDPAMFDLLDDAEIDGPAAVVDAGLLRRFNQPDGIAHTAADSLAEQAVSDSEALTPDAAVAWFTESARILRATLISKEKVISYPFVGSTTLAVVAEVALMEATVHMLDLADAVGGVEPSPEALAATRDLLIAVPDPPGIVWNGAPALGTVWGTLQPGHPRDHGHPLHRAQFRPMHRPGRGSASPRATAGPGVDGQLQPIIASRTDAWAGSRHPQWDPAVAGTAQTALRCCIL
jgi:uncharacterized protein (TIGR03083 family)